MQRILVSGRKIDFEHKRFVQIGLSFTMLSQIISGSVNSEESFIESI